MYKVRIALGVLGIVVIGVSLGAVLSALFDSPPPKPVIKRQTCIMTPITQNMIQLDCVEVLE